MEKTKKNDISPVSKTTKRNDFVEIKYTGYANEGIFDSNIEEDLKKLKSKDPPKKTVVSIGHAMLVKGLDKALEGKVVGKEYEISLSAEESFGQRRRELIRTIPMAAFAAQKVNPQPGMMLALDNQIVKIIVVSGARVTADFNNPLSGKAIKYKFKIIRIVSDTKEKTEAFFNFFFRFTPEFEIKEKNIIIKGPKQLEEFILMNKEKFKEIVGLDLKFEEEKKDEKEPSSEKDKKKATTSSQK